jgi:hypothetical protein
MPSKPLKLMGRYTVYGWQAGALCAATRGARADMILCRSRHANAIKALYSDLKAIGIFLEIFRSSPIQLSYVKLVNFFAQL